MEVKHLNRIEKKQIVFPSILIITIAFISIYIELVLKPQNLDTNSGKIPPFAGYMHSNLSIFIDGKPITIPSQIGINFNLWNDHSLDKFGFLGMPMDEEGKTTMRGMAPLYTTNDKGRITIGSIMERDNTLGEFLKIWGGLDIKNKLVNATVNGNMVVNYYDIILEDDQQIELYIQSRK